MRLTGLHILLTYDCDRACAHCFVWGAPRSRGTFSEEGIEVAVRQAHETPGIDNVWFEGGEPFLHPDVLAAGVHAAGAFGLRVGVVTNAFWASSARAATEALQPLAGRVATLLVSADPLHWGGAWRKREQLARTAAEAAGMSCSPIVIPGRPPGGAGPAPAMAGVMHRGRAAVKLAPRVAGAAWESFTRCPHEPLAAPARVHLDPLWNVHLCQGLTAGHIRLNPLATLCAGYDPVAHPVVGPLVRGGPAELLRAYGLPPRPRYADACHACYEARLALRARFPEWLGPDQMYGAGQGNLL
ncbi:MAG: radical SAM protein [bacterium]